MNEKNINLIIKFIKQSYANNSAKMVQKLIKIKSMNDLINALELIGNINIVKYFLINTIQPKLNLIGAFFYALSYEKQIEIIKTSNSKLIKEIFNDLEIDNANEFIKECPDDLKKKIMISISPEIRKEILNLLKYEDGEIGSIMNTFFLSCRNDWTIALATQYLSDNREEITLNSVIFITDRDSKIIGFVNAHDILLEKDKRKLISIIANPIIASINVDQEVEDSFVLFQKYEVTLIPVLDSDQKLIGVLSDNDIIDVMSEEATDDIYKMYGIGRLNQPYTRTGVIKIVKSRILWLILLMIVSTLTSTVIDIFTGYGMNVTGGLSTIFLIPMIPVITGASGNAGSQSAATLIRSLSVGDISKNEYKKAIWKEFNVAMIISGILAIVNYARLIIYFLIRFEVSSSDLISNNFDNFMTQASIASIGISIALIISVILSKVIGASLPILALKINVDPASMASPLLTTIIDTITTTLLFSIGIGFIEIAQLGV